jgi:hypothetical protein
MTRLKQAWLALCVVACLSGCREPDLAMADGRVLYDSDGRAFYVRPGFGDTSFIKPVPDANTGDCAKGKRK